MEAKTEEWKPAGRKIGRNTLPIFQSSSFQSLMLLLAFVSVVGMLFVITILAFAEETEPPDRDSPKTKEEQNRQILIEIDRLTMELAKKLMDKKQVDLENLKAMMLEENNIVTVSEVNKAEEAYERAVDEYEQAKLTLQQTELDSLKDEWHITVEETRLYESLEGREKFSIVLRNSSSPVKLIESSKVLGREIIISAQIDNIFVTIKEQEGFGSGAIITEPYEQRIETLKEGESVTLEFELIKENVRDVVVELKYADAVDEKNIHLKQEDPYISVVSARRYKEGDRRRLEVVLIYGALKGETEETNTNIAQEINNVYVSIKDDTESIIGYPYEPRIPTLKDGEEKTLDFELRRNVDSLTVNLKYLDKDISYKIHLEEDTRYISILSAKKFRVDNQMMVTIQLKNTSTTEAMPVNATPEEIAAANEIRGIYVSLLDVLDGTNIVKPYEEKIPVLGYNETVDLTFQLQKDVESLQVSLNYPELAEPDTRLIYLQKESALDVVNVSSLRFSQEGNLGSSITYDLTLDRLAETENTFQLRVINLLNRLNFEFQDPETKSRQSQVKFTQEQSKRNLSLIVYLPEELDASYLDSTLEFYVAVLDETEANELGGVNNRLDLPADRIASIQGGVERFELIPKGVPEIEVFVPNAFQTIKIGEEVNMTATLKNIGTRDLVDIRMVVDVNTDWKYTVVPEVIGSLGRNEETEIQLTLSPPADIGVGEYQAKLNAEVTVDNRKFEARDRSITVQVESKTQMSVTTLLFGALILLMIAIVIVTIRISRR
ncbi:MAG: NEW3 domain-containing protein [Candidatus Poribacteria bacterium]|nr:NEW3 domain-containing protein [Candidatus Poribacteria bacterium]